MNRMRVGDEVKVVFKLSPWWDARGVITEIVQRRDEQKGKTLQECAVTFKQSRSRLVHGGTSHDFLNMFEEKLRRARESEYSIQYLKAS